MKIFGIGLSRTGTTSLTEALRILGYSAIHNPKSVAEIDAHDASTDSVVATGFKLLDVLYPGSRFICTMRPPSTWHESMERFWKINMQEQDEFHQHLHTGLYGHHKYHVDIYQSAYDHHRTAITRYFASRPDDLLWYDVRNGWKPLCDFLGKLVPDEPFPHLNKS